MKLTGTVTMTGTATPFSNVGVNSHGATASTAAASNIGIDWSTIGSCTFPLGSIVTSMTTAPFA